MSEPTHASIGEPCPFCGCPGEKFDGHVCEDFRHASINDCCSSESASGSQKHAFICPCGANAREECRRPVGMVCAREQHLAALRWQERVEKQAEERAK